MMPSVVWTLFPFSFCPYSVHPEAPSSCSRPSAPSWAGPQHQEESHHRQEAPRPKVGSASALPTALSASSPGDSAPPSALRPTGDGACCYPSGFLTPAHVSVNSPLLNSPRIKRVVCAICSPPGLPGSWGLLGPEAASACKLKLLSEEPAAGQSGRGPHVPQGLARGRWA